MTEAAISDGSTFKVQNLLVIFITLIYPVYQMDVWARGWKFNAQPYDEAPCSNIYNSRCFIRVTEVYHTTKRKNMQFQHRHFSHSRPDGLCCCCFLIHGLSSIVFHMGVPESLVVKFSTEVWPSRWLMLKQCYLLFCGGSYMMCRCVWGIFGTTIHNMHDTCLVFSQTFWPAS